MVIVLLNFLIAEVSATYETVKEGGAKILYAKRAELNLKTQEIYALFGMRSSFRVIVYTSPQAEDEEDDMIGVIDAVSENVQKMITKNKQEMNTIIKSRIQKTQQQMSSHIDKSFSALEGYIHKVENRLFDRIEHGPGHYEKPKPGSSMNVN